MKNSIVPAHQLRDVTPVPEGPTDIAPYEQPAAETGDDDGGGDGGAKLRRYWAAIKRFRWLITGFAAAGTIAGVVATRFIDPVYEARGALWIADVGNSNNGGGVYRPPELLPNGSWIQLIRSFKVVDAVVAKQQLFIKPHSWQDSLAVAGLAPTPKTIAGDYTFWFTPSTGRWSLGEAKRGTIERGSIGDSVGRPVGFAWVPTAASLQNRESVKFTVLQPRTVSVDLIKRLDVAMMENSNFLTLTLSGPDKWQTANLLNEWMQQFVTQAQELRKQSLVTQAEILQTQKQGADAGLRDAENALQAFRSNSITKPSDAAVLPPASVAMGITPPQDAIADQYFKAQTDLADVQRTRASLEAMIPAARQGNFSADALAAIPGIATAPALSAAVRDLVDEESKLRLARQQFTDEYPAVKTLIGSVNNLRTHIIPDLLATQVDVLKRREAVLQQGISSQSAELRGIPARTIEEARLRRNVATAEGLAGTVETRYEAARLGAESTVPDVTILDPALPAASAQRDMKAFLVLGGLLGATAFGAIIALLLDLIDRRFRYPEQIADELGLEVLGAIPNVPKPGEADKDPEAVLQSVEAFRGLRMNLHHAFRSPPVMVTITSPGVGDGKSMIASNLALSFAEAGFRTLLIDGDIRRGKLHSIFGLDRRPGLLDYLAGDVDAVTVMREVPVHGSLTLIPCGTRRHRGPELLTSARLPALLNMLRSRFDVILVDSAPLAAGVDSYALSVATRNMLLVMRTGHTDRRVAKAKLKLMQRLPVRIVGAVVNAVSGSEAYAEYSYLYGYGPDADADTATTLTDEVNSLPAASADAPAEPAEPAGTKS